MALKRVPANQPIRLTPLSDTPERAHSYALVKTDTFQAMQVVLPAGVDMARHKVDGAAIIHVLEGKVDLILDDHTHVMQKDDWMHLLPGEPHEVVAQENSMLLVTVLFIGT